MGVSPVIGSCSDLRVSKGFLVLGRFRGLGGGWRPAALRARTLLRVGAQTSENTLQLYGVHSTQEELFPGVAGLGHGLRRLDIFLSANIFIESGLRATGLVGDHRVLMLSLSDGRFMLFSWQGVVTCPPLPLPKSTPPPSQLFDFIDIKHVGAGAPITSLTMNTSQIGPACNLQEHPL